jgi:hypothetical protein
MGEQLDLKPFVRDYVSSIGKVHAEVRKLLSPDLATWDQTVKDVLDDYAATTGDETFGLVIVIEVEPGIYSESIHISPNVIERRLTLEKKNRFITNFTQIVISSEIGVPKS